MVRCKRCHSHKSRHFRCYGCVLSYAPSPTHLSVRLQLLKTQLLKTFVVPPVLTTLRSTKLGLVLLHLLARLFKSTSRFFSSSTFSSAYTIQRGSYPCFSSLAALPPPHSLLPLSHPMHPFLLHPHPHAHVLPLFIFYLPPRLPARAIR